MREKRKKRLNFACLKYFFCLIFSYAYLELLFQAAGSSQFPFPLAAFIRGRNFLVKPSTMLIADVSKVTAKKFK